MERLSEAGMKLKPDDGNQKSMTYSSESEDSQHSLVGGVIQYTYYIFSILVSSLHAVEACIRHIRGEFYSILFFLFFIVICDCNLELYSHINCCIHTTLQGDQIMFRLKKWIFYPNSSAILNGVRNVFKYQIDVRNGFLVVKLAKKVYLFIFVAFICQKVIFS